MTLVAKNTTHILTEKNDNDCFKLPNLDTQHHEMPWEKYTLALIRQPSVVLVKNLHTRMGISITLSFAFTLEESQVLLRRLCRRGVAFLARDEGQLETFCVPQASLNTSPSGSPSKKHNNFHWQIQQQYAK